MMKINSKNIMTLVGLSFIFLFRLIPAPAGLSSLSMQMIGIFIGIMLLWNFVGIGWPSFFCIVLLALYQIMKPAAIFQSGLGNSIVNFLIAFFMLSYVLSQTGFTKRLAIMCISNRLSQKGPWVFTTMFLFATMLLASLMSQTAAALVFLPIAEQIFKEVGYTKGERYPQMLVLGIGFAVGFGSGNTPLGHTIVLIPIQLLAANYGIDVNIVNYSIFGFVTGIVIFTLVMLMFRFIYRPDISKLTNFDAATLKQQLQPMSKQELISAVGFFSVIIIWFLQGILKDILPEFGTYLSSMGNAIPVMIVIVLLSVWRIDGKPIMNFDEAVAKGVPWVGTLFTAAVMILSSALTKEELGISNFLVDTISPIVADMAPAIFILVIIALCVVLTNLASNTVVTTVFFTIAAPIAASMGNVNLATLAAIIGAASSYAYATPPSTMPMAVIAGTGWVDTKDMFRYGSMVALISIAALIIVGFPLANVLF